ncbi:BrxA family protein [Algoriphagus formosus]|uniref:BrxA family protein n=1 Tax=Algoriphagus formosus TaxID=2007308 RepID=UPI000C293172|nr:BrxA family protein [Algoriphagus formosus]
MKTPKYIALTSGALLFNEFEQLIPILEQENQIELLNQESKANQFMRIKTESARKRIITEIKRRIANLPSGFWSFYETATFDQRNILLFFIVLKNYEITKDFQFEVVLAKWKRLETTLDTFDLQMRLDVLASVEEDIMEWSDSTRLKVITVFLRCLREVGILNRGKLQKLPAQSSGFWEFFIQIGEAWFLDACLLSKNERELIR